MLTIPPECVSLAGLPVCKNCSSRRRRDSAHRMTCLVFCQCPPGRQGCAGQEKNDASSLCLWCHTHWRLLQCKEQQRQRTWRRKRQLQYCAPSLWLRRSKTCRWNRHFCAMTICIPNLHWRFDYVLSFSFSSRLRTSCSQQSLFSSSCDHLLPDLRKVNRVGQLYCSWVS